MNQILYCFSTGPDRLFGEGKQVGFACLNAAFFLFYGLGFWTRFFEVGNRRYLL